MFQSIMTCNNPIDKSIGLYQRQKGYRYMNIVEVVVYKVVIISSSIYLYNPSQVDKKNVQILPQCSIEVPFLLHLICTMLTNMGGNWGFEGQCRDNSIKTCQYSLSRFYGFYGSVLVHFLVNLSRIQMFSIMLIRYLSNTPNDDDQNMQSNLLSIV